MVIGNPKAFLEEARYAQAAHRDNLGAGGGSALEGQDPAALKMMPALAQQVELARQQELKQGMHMGMQHTPKMGLGAPSLGPGGMPGMNLNTRVPKPPTSTGHDD